MNLSKKQLEVLAFPKTDYDAVICDGSVRAGKTSIMSVTFVIWAMQAFDGKNFGLCSKTVGTCMKNVVKPLMAMQYMQKRYRIQLHASQGEVTITNGKHTNTFYIYGGKDESSYQLIQGITLAGVLLDEVALMPRSFVEQALARCSVDGRKFFFNCNPEGQMHWFYREWVLKAEQHNALRLHFTMDDNPGLSDKIKQDYESMYSGVFYDRYIKGLWVAAEGLIYDMFSEECIIDELPECEGDYYVSSDFGIQNATTFLLWRKTADSDVWACIDEYYYSGREKRKQKTVKELVDGLSDMLGDIVPRQIIVDPSAAALIVELRKKGVHVADADNDVLNGIADVGTMLNKGKLKFMRRCKHTIEEFGMYVWDEKAAQRGEDRPVKDNDHCMDAVRYFVKTKKLVKRLGRITDTESSMLL